MRIEFFYRWFVRAFENGYFDQAGEVESEEDHESAADPREPYLHVIGGIGKHGIEQYAEERENRGNAENKANAVQENTQPVRAAFLHGRAAQIRKKSRNDRQHAGRCE